MVLYSQHTNTYRGTMKSKKVKIAIFIITFALIVLFCVIASKPIVHLADDPELFRQRIEADGIRGKILFLCMIIFQVIFAFIPGEPLELLAGYAFGTVGGTLLCMLGTFLGGSLVFLFTKKFGSKFVELFFSKEKINSVKFFNDTGKMYSVLFAVFFIPGTPKDLLSYVAGLTPLKYVPYIIITTVARIPSIITSTVSGNAFGTKKYLFGLIAFAVTGILSISGLIIYNKFFQKKQGL